MPIDILFIAIPQFYILISAGLLVGIFSVIIGGGMFFSVPLIQALFPEATFGAVVGNIKAGSFFRGLGSTISTFKQIDWRQGVQVSVLAFIGTAIGASLIADLDQKWLFPALCFAVLFAVFAPKMAKYISRKVFALAAFLVGIYTGFFGAGIGVVLLVLLRLKFTSDEDIAHVKIQARFIEWLLVFTAVFVHYYHGNLVTSIWVPWSIGSVLGGVLGGSVLKHMGHLPGKTQKYILYMAFAFALIVAGIRTF